MLSWFCFSENPRHCQSSHLIPEGLMHVKLAQTIKSPWPQVQLVLTLHFRLLRPSLAEMGLS